MKKLSIFLLLFLLLSIFMSFTALADLLVEPDDSEGYEEYYDEEESSEAEYKGNTEEDSSDFLIKLAVVVLVPIIIAAIVCSIWKSQMKTAVIAKTASNYIPPGGFKLTNKADTFLYRTQTRTKIQTSSSSSGTTK